MQQYFVCGYNIQYKSYGYQYIGGSKKGKQSPPMTGLVMFVALRKDGG
jgi:hypothetical protein